MPPSAAASAVIRRHTFDAADNRRLAHLCGPLDAHLRSIEAALGVTLARRDASFRIEGPRDGVERAVRLLDTLYAGAVHPLGERALQLALLKYAAGASGAAGDGSRTKTRSAPDLDAVIGDADAGTRADDEAGADADAATPAAAGSPRRSTRGGRTDGPPAAADQRQHAAGPPDAEIVLHTRHADLTGRTPNQMQYLRHILGHDIAFGIGPAGTGKTFLAVACAVDALERHGVQRIVLTRPAVEAGERLGFLPGDLAQKVDPYLRPLYDALYDLMGFDRVSKAFEKGLIEIAPLAFMRGRTLNHAFVILDEAQNTTREQMKMFLTRIGFGSKCVVTGDVSQIDLPKGMPSGLVDAAAVLQRVNGIAFTHFTAADVVRHPLVARIVEAYERARGAGRRGRALSLALQPGPQPTSRPALQLSLQFADARHRAHLPRHRVTRWIRAALALPAQLTVRVVGLDEGRALNRQYRGQDHATNVLTFDYERAPTVVADLVLCAPVVEREAVEQALPLDAHYAHLLVHGTLHAQGHDHLQDDEAAAMEARESAVLVALGYADPYFVPKMRSPASPSPGTM